MLTVSVYLLNYVIINNKTPTETSASAKIIDFSLQRAQYERPHLTDWTAEIRSRVHRRMRANISENEVIRNRRAFKPKSRENLRQYLIEG